MAEPQYSKTQPGSAADANARNQRQNNILGRDARLQRAIHPHLDRSATVFCSRHCVARTCSTWLVPMPNASAPNAPCVAVWLSPQTTVMPGCVKPSSGPITCTMPCLSLSRPIAADAEIVAIFSSWSTCAAAICIQQSASARRGRHAVVGGGDRQIRPAHLQPALAQPLETPAAKSLHAPDADR